MEITQALQSVRFVVDQDGNPTDALLSIEAWNALIEQLEDLEDAQIVREAMARLKAAGGDPEAAGMIPWEQAQAELDALERDKAAA